VFAVEGLTKAFGGLTAVNELTMSVGDHEKVGLIGPNGAGKTTAFNAMTGFTKPTSGRVVFNGENIAGLSAHSVAEKGVVRTFQLTSVFGDFTVLENIMVGSHLHPKTGFWEALLHTRGSREKQKQVMSKAMAVAEFAGLADLADKRANVLSHGQKRILGIAVALAAEPKLLLLDEPLTGMNAREVTAAMELIEKIWATKASILLIEHNMRAAMSLCERVVVLNFGKKIAEGTPAEIQANEEVIQAYLGVGKSAIASQ
jgi:branched-chain amino acid transport system ATP-binding protein